MAQIEHNVWSEDDMKEAIRRIQAGEINFKEAESAYGIAARTILRQKAIESMRAQLNPERTKKSTKSNGGNNRRDDAATLRKATQLSSTVVDMAKLLEDGTDEVKHLLRHECEVIYECKMCRNLYRSFANFLSHKRLYCTELHPSVSFDDSPKNDETELLSTSEGAAVAASLSQKERLREFVAKPFRVTCKKDLTNIVRRITGVSDLLPAEPILHLQTMDTTTHAYQQLLFPTPPNMNNASDASERLTPQQTTNEQNNAVSKQNWTMNQNPNSTSTMAVPLTVEKRFRCPVCSVNMTLKKSVLRHLKSLHNKNDEQIERMKPRIQMHYVRIDVPVSVPVALPSKRIVSSTTTSTSTTTIITPSVSSTSALSQVKEKPESWQKVCSLCNKSFCHRKVYASHMKMCRRNAAKMSSRLPVVSLTPLANEPPLLSVSSSSSSTDHSSIIEDTKHSLSTADDLSTNHIEADIPSAASDIPSAAAPLAATTAANADSSAKRISIQVRMNYGKQTPPANSQHTRSSLLELKNVVLVEDEDDEVDNQKDRVHKRLEYIAENTDMKSEDADKELQLNGRFECATVGCGFSSEDGVLLRRHIQQKHSSVQSSPAPPIFRASTPFYSIPSPLRCPAARNVKRQASPTPAVANHINGSNEPVERVIASKRKSSSPPDISIEQPKRKSSAKVVKSAAEKSTKKVTTKVITSTNKNLNAKQMINPKKNPSPVKLEAKKKISVLATKNKLNNTKLQPIRRSIKTAIVAPSKVKKKVQSETKRIKAKTLKLETKNLKKRKDGSPKTQQQQAKKLLKGINSEICAEAVGPLNGCLTYDHHSIIVSHQSSS